MTYRDISAIGPRLLDDRSLVLYIHDNDGSVLSYEDIVRVLGVYITGVEAAETTTDRYVPRPQFSRGKQYPVNIMVNNEIPQGWRMGVEFPRGAMANDRIAKLFTPGFKCDGLRFYVGPLCDNDCEGYLFIFNDVSLRFPEYSSLIGQSGIFGQDSQMYAPTVEMITALDFEPLRRLDSTAYSIYQQAKIKCNCSVTCQDFYVGVVNGYLRTGDRFETEPDIIDLSATLSGARPVYTIAFGKYLYFISNTGNVYRMLNDVASAVTVNVTSPKFIHQDRFGFWWLFGDGPQIAVGTTIENASLQTTALAGETVNAFAYDKEGGNYYLGCESGKLVSVRRGKNSVAHTFSSAIKSTLYLYGKILLVGLSNGEVWEIREGGDPQFLIGFDSSVVNMIGEFERHVLALGDGRVYMRDLLTGSFTLLNSFSNVPLISYCLDDSTGYTGINHILFIDGQDVSQASPCDV